MGWKRVKEHYKIDHIVHVNSKGICIGSNHISDIIVISPAGELLKVSDSKVNADIVRYQESFKQDPAKLRELLLEQDTFARSVTVYTYSKGQIIEKHCETPGWPNVTHDGTLMYENLFSTDVSKVVYWAKRSAAYGVKNYTDVVTDTKRKLAEYEQRLEAEQASVRALDEAYPDIVIEPVGN